MAADLAAFQCPFADAGCPFTSASDRELSKHVADDTQASARVCLSIVTEVWVGKSDCSARRKPDSLVYETRYRY